MTSIDRPTADEPLLKHVSPELALVDPELARRLRERLPDYGAALVEPVNRQPAAAAPPREWAPAASPQRRRIRPLRVPAVLVGVAAAVALPLLLWTPWSSPRPSSERSGAPTIRRQQPAAPRGLGDTGAQHGRANTVPRRRAPAHTSRGHTTVPQAPPPARTVATSPTRQARPPARTVAAAPEAQAPKPAQAAASPRTHAPPKSRTAASPTTRPASSRVFAWVPDEKADFYIIAFYRGRMEIYEARTSKPRITLPPHWTFKGHRDRLKPGRYRWTVRTGFGSPSTDRYGKVLVEANLVVPK